MSLLDLLDRPIAFHRPFVTLTGSVPAALMLSQAVYWQLRCPRSDGWWWKTAEEWEDETGLKRDAQLTARKLLARHCFWLEKRRGIPAKAYYRIDATALEKALNIQLSGIPTTCNGESREQVEENGDSKLSGIDSTISENTSETTSKTLPRARSARDKTRGAQPAYSPEQPTPASSARERLSFEYTFGLEWQPAWGRHLADERAVSILLSEGIEDADLARRIVAEWAAAGSRGFAHDPAATLVWLCRNRTQLAHTAAGDECLPNWAVAR